MVLRSLIVYVSCWDLRVCGLEEQRVAEEIAASPTRLPKQHAQRILMTRRCDAVTFGVHHGVVALLSALVRNDGAIAPHANAVSPNARALLVRLASDERIDSGGGVLVRHCSVLPVCVCVCECV